MPPVHRPAWVDGLDERIDQVPAEAQPAAERIATPTVWPREASYDGSDPSISLERGRPEDLTTPLDRGSAGVPSRPAAPPPSGPGGGDGRGHGDVTVTVNNHAAPAEAEVTPIPALPTNDPSALERMYAGSEPLAASRDALRQFGYDFFDKPSEPGEALGPVAADYMILPGDELRVVLSGTKDGSYERIVARDGTIAIPDVGTVVVAGRRQDQLADAVLEVIRNDAQLEGIRVAVSLGRLRAFQVHIVGEVAEPGMIEIPGRASLLTALAMAGGPRRSGSLRRVEIRRNGAEPTVVDLYGFLLSGETEGLEPLRPDDVLFVPPIGETVAIAGAVQRPGIYELAAADSDLSVADALDFAGGLTPFTFRPHAEIERTVDGRGRQRERLSLDEAGQARLLKDGELLLIGAVEAERQPVVQISGEVARPAAYPYRDGMTVTDLLTLADGLTVDAYLPRALLSRRIGAPGTITLVPGREAQGTTERVLVIDLAKARAGDPQHDVQLNPLDTLRVLRRGEAVSQPIVEVLGAVRKPGTYRLTADLRVSDLVAIAGHVLPEVYYDEAELLRRVYDEERGILDVRRFRFDLGAALGEPGGPQDPRLASGDQLVIRALQDARVRVTISGRVRFPGEYVFPHGAKISDLCAAAGGMLNDADLRAAAFTRRDVQLTQQMRFQHLSEVTRAYLEKNFEDMVRAGPPSEGLAARLELRQTVELLRRMDSLQSTGRIVIPFTEAEFIGSDYDLTLREGDSLDIPPQAETVAVLGHVFNPGAFVAVNGITVGDLLARSGGVHEHGDPERVYVVRADGTVQSLIQSHYPLEMDAPLYAGDYVLVPRAEGERTLVHMLGDLLTLGRRGAELAYIMSRLGDDFPLNFTSVLQSDTSKEVDVLGDTLIER